jgi:repressor LexA
MPSLRTIAAAMGYGSPRSAQLMVERLRKEGFIGTENGRPILLESLHTDPAEQTVEVPLVGNVACGGPWLAEQHVEGYAKLSTKIAKLGHEYFLLRARGDSMNLAGIRDGDVVLVRKQPTANPGERIVALIDQEATIKHFYLEDGFVVLSPNSSDKSYRSIVLSDDFIIQGVVIQTIPDVFKEQ